MTPAEIYQRALALIAKLPEEQQREVRRLAKPFEWCELHLCDITLGRLPCPSCVGALDGATVMVINSGNWISYSCRACNCGGGTWVTRWASPLPCEHVFSLMMLWGGGHPMPRVSERERIAREIRTSEPPRSSVTVANGGR